MLGPRQANADIILIKRSKNGCPTRTFRHIYAVEILVLEDCLNVGNPRAKGKSLKYQMYRIVCSNCCSSLGHVMSDVAVVNYFVNILTVI